jgi:hypothetical protein
MDTEESRLLKKEKQERSDARARQRLAEEEEDRRLAEEDRRLVEDQRVNNRLVTTNRDGGSTIYMTQMEAACHVAQRLSLLQRWRGGDESAGQQLRTWNTRIPESERRQHNMLRREEKRGEEKKREDNMRRREEKRLIRMGLQGMPSILEDCREWRPQQLKQQQQQQQLHLQMGQLYICFGRRSGFGAPVPVLGVSERGVFRTAHGGSCEPSNEGRVWVFCDAFGSAIDGHALRQHVNLTELSGASFVTQEHAQGWTADPKVDVNDGTASEASFVTQEHVQGWTADPNVDVNDGTVSEASSDASYFATRWLPHDLV